MLALPGPNLFDEKVKELPKPAQKVYRFNKILSRFFVNVFFLSIIMIFLFSHQLNRTEYIEKEMEDLIEKSENSMGKKNVSYENKELRLFFQDNILFDHNNFQLNDNVKEKLRLIIPTVSDNMMVEVIGHTDNVGDYCYNYELSKKRAESVFKYIRPMLTFNNSMFYGLGEDFPVSSNQNEFGRSLNRRVEIIIKSNPSNSLIYSDSLFDKMSFMIKENAIIVILTFCSAMIPIITYFFNIILVCYSMIRNNTKNKVNS
ncbi:OmpA family protein [Algoriphagus locisalis]|uniref:OmpA family protein n=1 Tax=Algoriphagus locisalis TaxID=305507 RepID=A0A1I7E4W1_9BACT|nr:OmpA family protein [Algoriphagus locisalis]SFU18977.1 OmpA family protein [Algoriphagus locisalis]